MKRNYITLAAATAIGLVMSASAYAGNENTLYLDQDGNDNTALVHQSSGGGNNNIGTLADPVTQDGDHNSFRFSNSGSGSGTNNDIIKAEQTGDDNYFSMSTWNGANNNVVQDAQQVGDLNQMRIGMNGSDTGLVGTILQQGDNNHLVIDQAPISGALSAGNQVRSVTMLGSDNGLAPDANGAAKRAGTYIKQTGAGNIVQNAYVEGSNNTGAAGSSNTYRNVQRIEQWGSNNGLGSSIASTMGSDGNRIWVFEAGNSNNFSIMQGIDSFSTGNYATATQDGDYNDVTVTQYGDGNEIIVDQDGNGNTTTANFVGNGNGVGVLSGNAGMLELAHGELTQGTIVQDSSAAISGNSVDYNVTGDSNLFAFAQIGGGNTITGTVGNLGASNGNQVAIIQSGSSNASTFSQNGGGSNNIAVSQ
ncbi:hypothetical protein [Hoeflea sp.]|uniref:hypothetical protein n=1 Tax=Hoeflea sp. TaxID=1940281 RepID=UPI003A952F57